MTPPDLDKRELRYWPLEWRDTYEERAAILQFDASMDRPEAEAEARRLVLEMWRKGQP